ncbi:hypothetical protein PENSPDRAFT_237447 [Peniophora sp. CONT]|nr:hypothetical protein PENSPDRAFT_237447 [Peniophora sp. CONT]
MDGVRRAATELSPTFCGISEAGEELTKRSCGSSYDPENDPKSFAPGQPDSRLIQKLKALMKSGKYTIAIQAQSGISKDSTRGDHAIVLEPRPADGNVVLDKPFSYLDPEEFREQFEVLTSDGNKKETRRTNVEDTVKSREWYELPRLVVGMFEEKKPGTIHPSYWKSPPPNRSKVVEDNLDRILTQCMFYANSHQVQMLGAWDGLKLQLLRVEYPYDSRKRGPDGLRLWDITAPPIVTLDDDTDYYADYPARGLLQSCLLTLHGAGLALYHLGRGPIASK